MKPVMKIILMGTALIFAGAEMNAQEKKKKPQDNAYQIQKRNADEKRRNDDEAKRKSDSIARVQYRDSIAEAHRQDSVRWSKMGAPDSVNPAVEPKRDSLDNHDMPPKMDKGTPPKGPNPGIRRIDFGSVYRPEEELPA